MHAASTDVGISMIKTFKLNASTDDESFRNSCRVKDKLVKTGQDVCMLWMNCIAKICSERFSQGYFLFEHPVDQHFILV